MGYDLTIIRNAEASTSSCYRGRPLVNSGAMKRRLFSMIFVLVSAVLTSLSCSDDDDWETVASPTTAELRCLVLDAAGTPYLGTLGDGLWRGSGDGRDWSAVPGSAGLNVHELTLNDGYVYAATNDGLWSMNVEDSLTRLTGDGPLWALATVGDGLLVGGVGVVYDYSPSTGLVAKPAGLPDNAVTAVEDVDGTIFAGTLGEGLWRQSDENWERVHGSLSRPLEAEVVTLLDYDEIDGVLYLGSLYQGLYRSDDDGDSFIKERGRGPEYNYITGLVWDGESLVVSSAGIRAAGVFTSPAEEVLYWKPVAGSPLELHDLIIGPDGGLWGVTDNALRIGPPLADIAAASEKNR